MNLKDKAVLVLGGTHGMGRATVDLLIEGGARVTATGSRDKTVDRLRKEQPRVTGTVLDLADDSQVEALAGQVSDTLDAVIVFAAIAELTPLEAVSRAEFDRSFAINVRGVFFALQSLLPRLKAGGAIVLTTMTPSTATPTMGVYSATKAALGAYGTVLAAELLPRNIRVNMLAPGFIDTPTLGVAGLSEIQRAELHAIGDAVTPMRRHGRMDEIARAALFLAFDATFSTGIELEVDGGLSTVDAPVD